MADTSARMLRLLSLLQSHRHWPGPELSRCLEVSTRTLRRDVDRLRELGYPVRASRGLDGGYQLAAGATLPPLVLGDDEAVAIAVGLQTASHSGIEGVAESSVRALAQVVQVMPTRLRRRVEALTEMTSQLPWRPGAPAAAPDLLIGLAVACRDAERVRFAYTSASRTQSNRYAEPHRLVSIGRRWYVVAYDLVRHDWRSFRLDRIRDLDPTGEPFRHRELPEADAAAFVRAGIEQRFGSHEVIALVEAPEALVRERIGAWSDVQALDDRRCRVTMTVDSLEWAAMALGVAGAPFTVEAPPQMRDLLAGWARRFSDATA